MRGDTELEWLLRDKLRRGNTVPELIFKGTWRHAQAEMGQNWRQLQKKTGLEPHHTPRAE